MLAEIALATRCGSHIDTPLHRIAGEVQQPLERFVGPAYLADLRHLGARGRIDAAVLANATNNLKADSILLLATGWGSRAVSGDTWENQSPHVDSSGAAWLLEQGIRGVGIDHFSIGGLGTANDETHLRLLRGGVWIIEDLHFPPEIFRLRQPFKFWGLPMNWPGCSGAFCRPIVELA